MKLRHRARVLRCLGQKFRARVLRCLGQKFGKSRGGARLSATILWQWRDGSRKTGSARSARGMISKIGERAFSTRGGSFHFLLGLVVVGWRMRFFPPCRKTSYFLLCILSCDYDPVGWWFLFPPHFLLTRAGDSQDISSSRFGFLSGQCWSGLAHFRLQGKGLRVCLSSFTRQR